MVTSCQKRRYELKGFTGVRKLIFKFNIAFFVKPFLLQIVVDINRELYLLNTFSPFT